MSSPVSWIALVIGAVIACALSVNAWNSSPAVGFKAAGPIGSIQAVTLVNGQTYFGTLKVSGPEEIVLTDVFDLAAESGQEGGQRATKLIRRTAASIYGPTDLTLPIEKILPRKPWDATRPWPRRC